MSTTFKEGLTKTVCRGCSNHVWWFDLKSKLEELSVEGCPVCRNVSKGTHLRIGNRMQSLALSLEEFPEGVPEDVWIERNARIKSETFRPLWGTHQIGRSHNEDLQDALHMIESHEQDL